MTSVVFYNPLLDYLSGQAANPHGFVGGVVTKIWASYFANLSGWTIENTKVKYDSNVLDVGYGGGSTIKNLVDLEQNMSIYGVDISEESYKTAVELNKEAINNGEVKLAIGDVANMSYPVEFFDVVFAIQTHMYWDNLQRGFAEIYRVMAADSVLILSSEKDKIDYHMDNFKTTESLSKLLKEIGFTEVEEIKNGDWILYTVHKKVD
ncbi:class I SAM-dependent methyltransferase [Candidatus Enterococcus huntleyi]|uniref:class I SAM-dependent methyltransferase n=1 Tax=Candidatus Enterococcus huntleyi TaxID=1857217 RepID=UPI00192A2016|nr:class I SAM-dependent methyltransferase [Enterococcus sp. JM4C]